MGATKRGLSTHLKSTYGAKGKELYRAAKGAMGARARATKGYWARMNLAVFCKGKKVRVYKGVSNRCKHFSD
jgi:hypothetical protein